MRELPFGYVAGVALAATLQSAALAAMSWLAGGVRPAGLGVIGLLGVWVAAESLAFGDGPRRGGRPGLSGAKLTFVALAAVVLVSLIEQARAGGGLPVGFVAVGLGATLRVAAVRALGPWFLDEPRRLRGQPRVRTGPYRWLGHPAEAGLVLIAAGVALACGAPIGGALAAGLLLPLVAVRAAREGRLFASTRDAGAPPR